MAMLLTLLHSEWPKIYGVLALLSAVALNPFILMQIHIYTLQLWTDFKFFANAGCEVNFQKHLSSKIVNGSLSCLSFFSFTKGKVLQNFSHYDDVVVVALSNHGYFFQEMKK